MRNRFDDTSRRAILGISGGILLLLVKSICYLENSDFYFWLLAPTSGLVTLITGTEFIKIAGLGFSSLCGTKLITSECSGINFFIITSSLSYFLLLTKDRGNQLLFKLMALTAISYIITISVNAIRITLALSLGPVQYTPSLLVKSGHWIHQGIGIIVFFSTLLVYYTLLERSIQWYNKKTL